MSINSPVCAGLGGTGGDISFPLSDVFLASFPLSRLQLLGVVFTAGREWKNCHRHQHFQFSDLLLSMSVKRDRMQTPNNICTYKALKQQPSMSWMPDGCTWPSGQFVTSSGSHQQQQQLRLHSVCCKSSRKGR